MLNFLNGKKTVIALVLGYVAHLVVSVDPATAETLREAAMVIGTIGVGHKLVKMK